MVQFPVVFGEWVFRDQTWDFVVDKVKGRRMLTLREGCTHRELIAMAQDDFMLEKETDLYELSYPLPEIMLRQMGQDSPHVYVTNDRQVLSMIELARTHLLRLCVSTRSGMGIGKKEDVVGDSIVNNDDIFDKDEEDEGKEDEDDEQWEAEEEDEDEGSVCGGGGDDDDGDEGAGNLDAEEKVFKQYAETYCDDADYTVYGKVKDEDVILDENYKNYELDGVNNRFIGKGKSWSDGIWIHKCFASKEDLQSELRLTAIMLKFAYRVEKSDKKLFVDVCRVEGCMWRLRAAVKNEPNKFWVMIYNKSHTCSVVDRISVRKRYTPQYIGWLFVECFGIIDGITPKHVRASLEKQLGIKMIYTTSYRALLHAQKLMRGSPEDGYERLPSLLDGFKQANPGTITDLELDEQDRFKYLFLAFGASIYGFRFLRRVIVVDGTHLMGNYGGVMVVAAAQDGNFQIFHEAFGIVDFENDASWEWFFTRLRSCLENHQDLVIVSNRHNSIEKAYAAVFPWEKRGICYYHLQQNIVTHYKGRHLLYFVKNKAYAYTLYDYNRYMASLRALNPPIADYLEEADPRLWSQVHFLGDRYNIKTSNIAESINSALKMARGYLISFLLEFIQYKLRTWFCKKRLDALSLKTPFSRGVEYLMAIREYYADIMMAERIDGYSFVVKGGHRDCIVDLEHYTCECGVWRYERIPCSHALCVAPELQLHPSTLVCPSYGRDYLFTAYYQNIFPNNSSFPPAEPIRVLSSVIKRPPGRPHKSRWLSWLEISNWKGNKPRKLHKQYSCSNCKQPGHKLHNCTTKAERD